MHNWSLRVFLLAQLLQFHVATYFDNELSGCYRYRSKRAVSPFDNVDGLDTFVGGIKIEFQLLPKLAKSQSSIDKDKLQSAASVDEAIEIARASL
nr:monodehydroascorbate reductase 5, mitochondrial isoform X2 [Tanacetum cinerariifolium]